MHGKSPSEGRGVSIRGLEESSSTYILRQLLRPSKHLNGVNIVETITAPSRCSPCGENSLRNGCSQPLQQGFVEGSNVNVVEEMVNMIETQRAYEMNSKAISTADQMLQYVSQNL